MFVTTKLEVANHWSVARLAAFETGPDAHPAMAPNWTVPTRPVMGPPKVKVKSWPLWLIDQLSGLLITPLYVKPAARVSSSKKAFTGTGSTLYERVKVTLSPATTLEGWTSKVSDAGGVAVSVGVPVEVGVIVMVVVRVSVRVLVSVGVLVRVRV